MITRRRLIFSASAAAVAAPALARTYVIPEAHKPHLVVPEIDIPQGEIVVAPSSFCLYWGLGGGQAIRYRVGVARRGLYRSGRFRVGRMVQWPRWTPTANMIRREPEKYRQYADGMPGGPINPLGARALYLYSGGRDTLMRIHGTPEPWTVGTATSSGCVRLVNDYVLDLYARVEIGTPVRMLPQMGDQSCADRACYESSLGQ